MTMVVSLEGCVLFWCGAVGAGVGKPKLWEIAALCRAVQALTFLLSNRAEAKDGRQVKLGAAALIKSGGFAE